MTLGEHITWLRTSNNWSQDELAARLGVSRQSVSKWETDASIPDLNKLLAMSEVFGITLDELVKGKRPEQAPPETPPQPQIQYVVRDNDRYRSPARTAGVILLCFGWAIILLLTLMGDFGAGAILACPLFVSSIPCFACKKHPGLWCAWTMVLSVILFLQSGTGVSWTWSLAYFRYPDAWKLEGTNIIRLLMSIGMLLALLLLIILTLRAYRDVAFPLTRRNKTILTILWIAVALTQLFSHIDLLPQFADWRWRWLTILQDTLALAALLPALIFTLAAYRTHKKS